MSFDWTIPPANTYKERQQYIDQFTKALEQRTQLNQEYEKALNERLQSDTTGVSPIPVPQRTMEEVQSYNQYQIDTLKTRLMTIMSEADVVAFLGDYKDVTDTNKLEQINKYWDTVIYPQLKNVQMNKELFDNYIKILFQKISDSNGKLNEDDQYTLADIWVRFKNQNNPQMKSSSVGTGVSKNNIPKYLEFGKYCIHIKSLKQHFLNVKYKKSLSNIPYFPKQLISKAFADFILETLENKKVNQRMLESLPSKEQKLFKKLALQAEFDHTLKISTNDEDENALEERFEVLRGSVMAGNNSTQMLRELKSIICRFMATQKMNRSEGNSLLAELSLII